MADSFLPRPASAGTGAAVAGGSAAWCGPESR